MDLRFKIAPRTLTATSKEELIAKISAGKASTFGTYGIYLCGFQGRFASVYNIQKVGKKTSQKKVKGKTVSTVIRRKHWVANVYDFNIDILKAINVKVMQRENNFSIEKI